MKIKLFILLSITVVITFAVAETVNSAHDIDLFARGIEDFNAGRWDEAANSFSLAASQTANDIVVRLTAGISLSHLKKYSDAEKQFEAAKALYPKSVIPNLLLEGVYQSQGHIEKARTLRIQTFRNQTQSINTGGIEIALESSVNRYPKNAIAYCLLGDLYQLKGDMENAKVYYLMASDLSPKWPKPVFNYGMVLIKSDPYAASLLFRRAIEMDPNNGNIWLWLGDAQAKLNEFKEAIGSYNKAAQDTTLAYEAKIRIANIQLKLQDYLDADANFSQVQQMMPNDPRPLVGQAQIMKQKGDLDQAEKKYKKAADVSKLNANSSATQAVIANNIAQVQIEKGDVDSAIRNLREAFKLSPTRKNADALVSMEVSGGKLAEGINTYENIINKSAYNRDALTYLNSAYRVSGNYSARLIIIKKLIKADKTNAHLYFSDLGETQACMGASNEALDSFLKSLEMGSNASWVHTIRSAFSLGLAEKLTQKYSQLFSSGKNKQRIGTILYEIYMARNMPNEAISIIKQLINIDSSIAANWLKLGIAYESQGAIDKAIDAYSVAAESKDIESAAVAKNQINRLSRVD